MTNIVQLLRIYLRSAEIVAGEKLEQGSVALPADMLEKVQQCVAAQEAQRAEDEARRSERQAYMEELIEMYGKIGKEAAALRWAASL